MIPRVGALEALGRFCIKHSNQGKIGTFTLDYIMKMACLILDTNYFAYNNKYYRQVRGGAMGSAFTQVLANICMLEWEQDLFQHQEAHNSIYGRYIDDIFMITNQAIEEINVKLEQAKNKDVNIKIISIISESVDFLDATVTNENGQLRTSIYHKPTTEPNILPYTSDHPSHIHHNIPYVALLRAARICSHVSDFNTELIRIDMTLLLNNYPPKFIFKQVNQFFRLNDAMSVLNRLDKQGNHQLHQNLLHQPTRREKKLSIVIQNHIETPLVLQPKIWNKDITYPRYLFDTGLTISLPKQFYNWWKTYYAFPGSPLQSIKVILVANTNRTLESFLIRKKPQREILTKME